MEDYNNFIAYAIQLLLPYTLFSLFNAKPILMKARPFNSQLLT